MKIRSFLRAGIIFVLLLGLGWFGIWILGQPGPQIKIEKPGNSAHQAMPGDIFYNFGGKTPDETIQLLVGALEKDDLALAAKYFVTEVRDAESEELKKLDNSQLLSDLIKTLKNIKGGRATDNSHYQYEVMDDTGQPAVEIDLMKNDAGMWKITSL